MTTGEVLIPAFKVNNAVVGETAKPDAKGNVEISLDAKWTFPLNRAEVISGDGKDVFHDIINLNDTQAFGQKSFKFTQNLKGRKWLRVELWDVAANGAFTQIIWLE